jgi:hypothetical protein
MAASLAGPAGFSAAAAALPTAKETPTIMAAAIVAAVLTAVILVPPW